MYKDRMEAGKLLGGELLKIGYQNPVVLAIPRGGVVVGGEVAKKFRCPLGVVVVRKIGAPDQPELALGAIAEGGVEILNNELIESAGYSGGQIKQVIISEKKELKRRQRLYKVGRNILLRNKTVIIVDDGLATGMTALAAVELVRKKSPAKIVFAVPVGAVDSLDQIRNKVDELVCPRPEENLVSIGQYYESFGQVSDDEVLRLLKYRGG